MKKTLGLVLAVAMLCTMIMPMGISATVFTDTEGTKYEKAVDVLSSIGIVEGRSEEAFEPDATLTRAEAATIILRLKGMEGAAEGKDIFTDVTSEHWAYSNVATAYGLQIVNGMGDGTFAPDASVTSAQAVKMLVCTLGYAVQADAQGGYPSGYISKGSQLGLFDNVTAKDNGEISRGEFAVMVYNALDVEVYEKTVYGENAYEYEVKKDVTILSRDLSIFKVEGQVTATINGYVTLPPTSLDDNEIVIAGKVYDMGETDAKGLLARNVVAYADFSDDENPVLLYVGEANQGDILTIDATDIVSTKTNKSEVVYEIDNKEYTAKLSNAVMIKNGDNQGQTWAASELYPDCGTVTLVSNASKLYTYVIVEAYEDYVVNAVNATSKIVYFKDFGGSKTQMEINVDDLNKKVEIIDAEGEPVAINKLAEWNVLSILESSSRLTAIVSKETVSGVVSEESRNGIQIGENLYELAASLKAAPVGVTKPAVGKNATYYLDFMGKIAAVNRSASGSNSLYAYLKDIGSDGSSAFASNVKAEVFDILAAKMNIVDFTDRVVFVDAYNIEKTLDKEELLEQTDLYRNGEVVPQLIRFERNEDGAITKLEVAQDYRLDFYGADEDTRQQVFSLDISSNGEGKLLRKGGVASNSQFTTVAGSMISGKYIIGSATKTLRINPKYTSKDFAVTTATTGWTHSSVAKCSYAYDASESGVLAVIVENKKELLDFESSTGGGSGDIDYTNVDQYKVAAVVSISKALDADEQPVNNLTLQGASGKIKMTLPDGFKINYGQINCDIEKEMNRTFKNPASKGLVLETGSVIRRKPLESYIYAEDLALGDIVQYEANAENEATFLNVIMKADNPGFVSMSVRNGGSLSIGSNENDSMGIHDAFWYMGLDTLYCSVVNDVASDGRVVATTYDPSATFGYSKLPTSKARVFTWSVPGSALIVDLQNETIKTGSYLDIAPGDTYCSLWGFTLTKNSNALTVVYKQAV